MKKVFAFLLFCLHSLCIFAQTDNVIDWRNKKAEEKLDYISYKYISGEYGEAIQSSKSFVSSLEGKSTANAVYLIKAKLLQANAQFATLQFSKAEEACKEAAALADSEQKEDFKFIGFLSLAEYHVETGNIATAIQNLDKASLILKSGGTPEKQRDYNFVKAKILVRQEYINEALLLIGEQMSFRLEMASTLDVPDANKLSLNGKIDFTLRKEKYAQLMLIKIQAQIIQGSFSDAEALIKNGKSWISTNLGKDNYLFRDLLERQSEISFAEKNYTIACSLYTQAYLSTPFTESEQGKIRDLSSVIITSVYSGQAVKVKNYLRRLEMYAFQKVGNIDPHQLAFEYSEAYKSFIEGDYTSANTRLNRLRSGFSFLPPYHLKKIEMEELRAAIALKSGDIKSYQNSLTEISGIKEKYYGEHSPAFHKSQLELSLFEIKYGQDYVLAEKVLTNSYVSSAKKEIINESAENMAYLTAYADLFSKTDRYDSAFVRARDVYAIARKLFPEKSPEYLLPYANYIHFQIITGNYKEGFENLQKAFELFKIIKSENSDLLQNAAMVLAKLYSLNGEFEKSKALLDIALQFTAEGYEKPLLAEAEASEQLASLYLNTGNYSKAEKSLLRSLSVKSDKLDKTSPLLISTYQGLATLNLLNGNFPACEKYLKMAGGISETVFGKQSLIFADCQLMLAEYFLSMTDLKKADAACKNADDIVLKILGKSNLKRAKILSLLAFIRSKIPSYNTSEVDKLYVEAENLIKNSIGSDNPLFIQLKQKQAEFYINRKEYAKAELLLAECEKYWKMKLGSENEHVAEINSLRGDISYALGKYDLAEKSYSTSRSLYASIFNENHQLYMQSSGKLARVYLMQKNPAKSLDMMEGIIPKYHDYVIKYFPSLSFKEKKRLWNNIKEEFDFYNFIALNVYQKDNPKLAGKVYDNIISTKALLLNSDIKVRESIISSNDSILIEYYNEWVAQKEFMTNILSLSRQQLADQNIDIKAIESRLEDLEKEMNARSEVFNNSEKKQNLSWKIIRQTLKDNEYAVEILRYRYFNKVFTDSILYTALIIHNKTNDFPLAVNFTDGKAMEKKYYKYFRNVAIQKMDDQHSYDIYWKPIKANIPDGATIYLSSDGVYNQLNVEMMKSSTGEYVIDQNQIVAVTNTKDLLLKTLAEKKKSGKEIRKEVMDNYVLCGNPDFYSGQVIINNKTLDPLPGAEKELLDLNNMLSASGKKTVRYSYKEITEDTLKYLNNPKVFHIATHGFFKEITDAGEDDLTSDPLLNSGLILFGGGDIINHPDNNYVNSKEGILTAYEATNLHFDKTELVVLSACETGRGELQVGEGVYGLQRSFLIAGADAIIMSLFKVNDEVTQKLMLSFYDKWLKTGDKRKAFFDAKKEIKKAYNFPIYWGVFVMIEGKPQGSGLQQQ